MLGRRGHKPIDEHRIDKRMVRYHAHHGFRRMPRQCRHESPQCIGQIAGYEWYIARNQLRQFLGLSHLWCQHNHGIQALAFGHSANNPFQQRFSTQPPAGRQASRIDFRSHFDDP